MTRGARNIALPLLRDTPSPKGLAKNVTVSAAMWTGSHGMRSVVNVSRSVVMTWERPHRMGAACRHQHASVSGTSHHGLPLSALQETWQSWEHQDAFTWADGLSPEEYHSLVEVWTPLAALCSLFRYDLVSSTCGCIPIQPCRGVRAEHSAWQALPPSTCFCRESD
jgi:hypothetical protein